MLIFVKQHRGMRRQKKQRKQRLFSVACCRRLRPLIVNDRSRYCVEVAERFADGQATGEELQAAEAEATAIWLTDAANDMLFACLDACRQSDDGLRVCTMTISAVFEQQQTEAGGNPDDLFRGRMRGACPSEGRELCRLLRCLFGNPFRPVAFALAWRTPTVVALAQAAYDERAFDRLPILADALEDAGCADAAILGHCRSPGPHVRGCWVVDLILGKQ
jgi:hypothetical protein